MKTRALVLALVLLPFINSCFGQTPRQIRNITAFCRLFGYIRYFHPSDETQKIDWEKLAIYGSRYVMNTPDDRHLVSRLKELFLPLAPTVRIFLGADTARFDRSVLVPPHLSGYRQISWQYTSMSMRFVKDFPRPEHATVRLNRSAWQLTPRHYDTAGQGFIYQYLPALYKGKFILEANIKVPSSSNGIGELALTTVTTKGQGKSYSATGKGTKKGAWEKYTLTGDISENSTQIVVLITLRKKGSLLAKDLKLSIMEDGHKHILPLAQDKWSPPPNNNYAFTIDNAALQIKAIDSLALSRQPDSPIYAYRTNVGEYIQKQLVPGVTCIVPLALYGTENHTYPTANPINLRHLIASMNLAVPAQPSADSLDVRLGDIVLAWNIYRHFFPFWQEASQMPEQILQDAISHSFQNNTEAEFFKTLKLMTAPLNDGHIFPHFDRDSTLFGTAGVSFAIAEGKMLVKDVVDKAFIKILRPGDLVDSINGATAWETLAAAEKYESGSPQGRRFMALYKLPFGCLWSPLQLTVHRGTDTIRTTLYKTGWNDWRSVIDSLPANGSEVADKVYYINLLEPGEKVAPLLDRLADAKAVIFDIRGYPSFDLFDTVMSRLITQRVTSQSILYEPQIVYPDFEKVKFTAADFDIAPKEPHIKCKVYFLSNAAIGSHPEYFLGIIKLHRLGTIIGQPTCGVNGTINGFSLPGGFGLTFTGMKVAPLPGTSSHLQGVLPDILIEPTVSSITAGRDETLQQAIKIASGKAIPAVGTGTTSSPLNSAKLSQN